MKKIFVCAMALAAFAACQKNEVVEMPQGTAIAFNTFVDKSTKVTEADDMSTANLKEFTLYGWRTTGETTQQIFDKQAVTVAGGVCTYSPLQYWQNGYTYQFEAVSPKIGDALAVTPAVGGSKLTFTSDSNTDLVWARPTEVAYVAAQTAPAPVHLTFQHLLSRVMFRVHNQFPENAAAKITVKSIIINAAADKAELDMSAETPAWAPAEGETGDVTFVTTGMDNIVSGGNYADTEHQYMIPADLTTVTLVYELDQNGVKNEYTATKALTGDPNLFLAIGRSLRINVVLNEKNVDPNNELFPIEFIASVDVWE